MKPFTNYILENWAGGGRAAEIRCFFPKFQGCTVTCNCQLNDENVSENREAKVSYGKSENKGETE